MKLGENYHHNPNLKIRYFAFQMHVPNGREVHSLVTPIKCYKDQLQGVEQLNSTTHLFDKNINQFNFV